MQKLLKPVKILIALTVIFVNGQLLIPAANADNIFDRMKNAIATMDLKLEGNNDDPLLPIQIVMNTLMGFLGIVFFILIIYAGILWMTAAGQEDKITKAKKILASSTIGLVIVFGAYLIAYVIIAILQGVK